jgi:hypothetical protein
MVAPVGSPRTTPIPVGETEEPPAPAPADEGEKPRSPTGGEPTSADAKPGGTTATPSTQGAKDANLRFQAETGTPFRIQQLQARLPASGAERDPTNAASMGTSGSLAKLLTSPPPGVPSLGQVHAAIQSFACDPNIPFSGPGVCYARAHKMTEGLESKGMLTSKAWAHTTDVTESLMSPGGDPWGYHVAPRVSAWSPQTGRVGNYIVDPSISGKPMTPSEWVGRMNPLNAGVRMEVTPNSAYYPKKDGGYYNINDPVLKEKGKLPDEAMQKYSDWMTSQGKTPNSGPPDGIPTDLEVAASGTGKIARLGSALTRLGGGLASIGGAVQTGLGVYQFAQGNKTDGAIDMLSGGLNVAGGTALVSGVGTVAAPFLFGASSAIDGGRDLYKGLTGGSTERTLIGSAKTVGAGLMAAGGVTALTGFGLPVAAGLFLGGAALSGGAALYDAVADPVASAFSRAWKGIAGS